MNFFAKISAWIRTHTVVTIIVGVVAVGGVTVALFLLSENVPKLNQGTNSTTLLDGTYSCELMYNGKSFDDDNVTREWLQKLATYEDSIDVDNINISDFRKSLFEEFGSSYIVKDNNIIKLNLVNGSEPMEYVLYDITSNTFTLGNSLLDAKDSDVYKTIETIFNKSLKVKQTKDSFTYVNFGFILIYPSIYNNAKNNTSSDGIIDIDYDKYTGLGDLICKTSISDDKEDSGSNKVEATSNAEVIYKDIIDSYSQYIYSYGKSGEIHLGTPGWYHYFDMSDAHDNCYSTYIEDQLACQDMEEVRTFLAYTFYDMDGDNVKELIVAQHGSYYSDTYNPSNEIMGIYYYENKQVKNLYLAPSGGGSNINILEDGYLKYSGGRQGNYYSNFVKKGKNWSKLDQVVSYETTLDDSGLTFTKSVPGQKDEVHKNITWDSLGDYDNSYNAVGKFEVDLNKLEWAPFLGQMD